MRKSKLPTVTVAIPAFNEEVNIKSIIKDVLSQRQNNYVLEKVIVYSDNSTDKTHEIVNNLKKKYAIISLKKGSKRIGKYLRMNQAFSECKTDIVVVLDADIKLVGKYFLERLVEVIVSDPKATMVSSHHEYLKPKTFVGRVIHADFSIWNLARLSMQSLENADGFIGMATAFRGTFANSIRITKDISDPHLYLYLSAAKINGFRYCYEAVIMQWPIATVEDYKKFLKRSLGKKDKKLEKIFAIDTSEEYFIPMKYKLIGLAKSMVQNPFYTPLGLLFNIYMNKIRKPEKADQTAIWEVVGSTKKKFK